MAVTAIRFGCTGLMATSGSYIEVAGAGGGSLIGKVVDLGSPSLGACSPLPQPWRPMATAPAAPTPALRKSRRECCMIGVLE
jgi:hypothetical protein